ncbi:MAG: ABC transporter ATP-binding protein [Ignavibacteriaceae bacterium]
MSNFSVEAKLIKKTFGRRLIFENINFHIKKNEIFGIAGPNGSGKSTLVKIIAGIISPSGGEIIHQHNGEKIISEKLHNYIGFLSPYLVLYDEFTAIENLNHVSKIRGVEFDKEKIDDLLNQFLLYDRRDDLVKTYSSGMKQRLKFIFALTHSPDLIIFDEPTSNLDLEGKESVYKIIKEESKNNLIIIASNEETDLAFCRSRIELKNF